jgi:predicted lipoprotein with Yx(FWY)xxD motif
MSKIRSRRTLLGTIACAALVPLAASGAASGAQSADASTAHAREVVAERMVNRTLDTTVLTTHRGFTLYSLSAETKGRFICTGSCTSLWSPLVVPRGTTPTGVKLLGTVKRPDGRTQVTYRGRPLYTFTQDRKPGDAKGNGFKDVGTWLAASVGASRPTAPAPTPASTPYG